MTNPIFASWCISNNIGDALTPWLIERITGNIPIFVPYAKSFELRKEITCPASTISREELQRRF